MTEEEWEQCEDPQAMLEAVQGKASDRKLRLYGCGCCRRIWTRLSDERSRQLVVASEQFADGIADGVMLRSAFQEAAEAWEAVHHEGGDQDAAEAVLGLREDLLLSQVIEGSAESVAYVADEEAWREVDDPHVRPELTRDEKYEDVLDTWRAKEHAQQAVLLRDIFGNPFRPVTFDPSWRTSTVVALARGIYEDRAFDRLPILADALMDAGCDNADILDHCRGDGPHARGCWAVDLLLGKS